MSDQRAARAPGETSDVGKEQTGAASGDSQGQTTSEAMAGALVALAWPVAALLVAMMFWRPLHRLVSAVAKRVADPRTSFSFTKEGVKLETQLEASAGKLESLELDHIQLKELALSALRSGQLMLPEKTEQRPGAALALPASTGIAKRDSPGATGTQDQPIDQKLRELAGDYCRIKHPSREERTREKEAAARRMGAYVVGREISRDALKKETDEGLLLALASAVHLDPEEADVDRLLEVADVPSRLHVKYRIAMAFGQLAEQRLVSRDKVTSIREALEQLRRRADAPLRRRIDRTHAILDTHFGHWDP